MLSKPFRSILAFVLLPLFVMLGCSSGNNTDPVAEEFNDPELQRELQSLLQEFNGEVGLYVRHLSSGRSVSINADELFPTASMIKIPILLTLFNKIESGQLSYDQELSYSDSSLYEGEDILGSFKNGEKILLSKLVMLMITMSDNTASLWCQQLAGTGTDINKLLSAYGFAHTRMNSRTPDRENNREQYGWGQTTPHEMAEMLVMIHAGNATNEAASEEMYRVLSNIYWNGEALSQIPPSVQAASKQGAVSDSRSEVVLVNAPSGDYVFCLITKNQQDTSWEYNNEGFQLIRSVSKHLWNYYEPGSKWVPAAGNEKWAK